MRLLIKEEVILKVEGQSTKCTKILLTKLRSLSVQGGRNLCVQSQKTKQDNYSSVWCYNYVPLSEIIKPECSEVNPIQIYFTLVLCEKD